LEDGASSGIDLENCVVRQKPKVAAATAVRGTTLMCDV